MTFVVSADFTKMMLFYRIYLVPQAMQDIFSSNLRLWDHELMSYIILIYVHNQLILWVYLFILYIHSEGFYSSRKIIVRPTINSVGALTANFNIHWRLKTELFKTSYPGSTPASPHVRHHYRLQP